MSIYLETEFVPVSCGADGCDQTFAMSRSFYNETQRGTGWTCPRGHKRVWRKGDSPEAKLQKAEIREQALKDQLSAAIRDAEETRVALLRDRQRFANGVCPCCNRTFQNVLRHMKGEHPDYDVTKVKQAAVRSFKCSCGRGFESLRGLRTHQGHQRGPNWDTPNASRWSAHLTSV